MAKLVVAGNDHSAIQSRCPAVVLVTLQDAGTYITKLPKAEQKLVEWQTAMQALLLVVQQNGPTMFARIGVMRALHRNVERVFSSDRKETHWGKRKLKRDQ